MKVIWISFLLIGLVVCGPMKMGRRSGGADPRFRQQPSSRYWFGGTGANSGSYGSSPLQSQLNPSYDRNVPAQEAGRQDFYSTTTDMDELDRNRGYVGGPEQSQYAASAYYAAAPAGNDDNEDVEGEPEIQDFLPVAESIFSDVSDLEPVYSFSSRSKYSRGRKVFQRSSYTPGEPAPPPPRPVMDRFSGPSQQQSRPADTPIRYIYG